MGNFVDRTGHTFSDLTVIRYDGVRNKKVFWWCRCVCGNEVPVTSGNLKSGHTKSCGCLFKAIGGNRSHGRRHTPEYEVWASMLGRCRNPNEPAYKDYGARGIGVSDSWCDFSNFISDMGERPTSRHTLERKDNDKGYSPDNCIWATRTEQGRNKRNNFVVEFLGKSQCLVGWCEQLNLNYNAVLARIRNYGWSVERAFTTPTTKPYVPYTKAR